MKAKRVTLFFILIVFFAVVPVHASYWTLTPDGQLDTDIGDEIAFDISFYSTETIYMISWELDFQFDDTEFAPVWEVVIPDVVERWKVDYNDFSKGFGALSLNNAVLNGDIYSLSAGSLSDIKTINPGDELLFATFYMEVMEDQVWDYLSDVELLSQIGTSNKGIQTYSLALSQYEGDPGVSVGNPVPIPGGVLLLGSGLIGLFGIRRQSV
jgi:hypothetical protein